MRTSRDLIRPLVALVVILATLSTVSTVAAIRSQTTTHAKPEPVTCPQVDAARRDERVAAACADRSAGQSRTPRREDADGDGDGDHDRRGEPDDDRTRSPRARSGRSGRHVVVVTRSGAS